MHTHLSLLHRYALPVTVIVGLGASFTHAQPANDMFANSSVISGSDITVTGSNDYATWEAGEPYHADMYGYTSVWWSWTAPSAGTVVISTAGSSFDTLLGVYIGSSVSALTEVASNDNEDYYASIYTSKVAFDATAGQTYQIAVDGYYGDWGSVQLSVQLGPLGQGEPTNDRFANRIVVTGTNITVTGSNVGATREVGEPHHAGVSGGASVWWSWTAPSAGAVTISTAGSSFDSLLGVYVGSSVFALTEVASNDDDAGLYTSKVVFDVAAGQTYQIAVDGYDGEMGSVRISVQLGPLQPPPPAPAWVLPDPYGAMVSSSSYAGKVVILDFWATWCGPCKAGMPDLVDLQDKYRADGLVVVGADTGWSGDTAQVVQSFLTTFTPTINYQIVMANSAMMQAYGGIDAIPTTFIIDRQNLIRKKYVGTQFGSTLEKQIIPLLYGNTCLACRRNGNQMILCWPANAQPFTLESRLTTAGDWSPWPTGPIVVSGTNTVQVPMTDSVRYFRLRMLY